MKLTVRLLIVVFALSGLAYAQTMKPVGEKKKTVETEKQKPVKVNPISLPEGYTAGQVTGDLKDGTKLSSLRWAERSSVACFPGTRFEMFTGNHVFYRITLPPYSSMKVIVKPKEGKEINLYALRQNMRAQTVPPNVARAVSCEASYPIYANVSRTRTVRNKDDGIRKVEYISVRSPFSILIGVAGAKGKTEGEFTLQIEIKSR